MAVYVVTWNLNKEKSNYSSAREAFVKVIDSYDTIRDTGLESVRFVSTAETVERLYTKLREKLDNNDRLFISQVNSGQRQGWLEQDVWDWINART